MGCFNKSGFISHLPIQSGDEIALFILVGENGTYPFDSTPNGICGKGLKPIGPPLFGQYNDYGGIMNIVDDVNHKQFCKTFGMPIEKFIGLNEYFGLSVSELDAVNADVENTYEEEKTDADLLLGAYHKVFNGCGNIGNLFFSYAMEHKAVYDKMVETAREQQNGNHFWRDNTPIDVCFDNTVTVMNHISNKLGETYLGENPLKIGFVNNLAAFGFTEALICLSHKVMLNDGYYFYPYDYAVYNNIKDNVNEFKDVLVDYAYFMKSMRAMNLMFDVSPYHGQYVSYEIIIPIFQKICEIAETPRE